MSRLTATAVYSRLTFNSVSSPSTVVPRGTSIGLPLTLIVIDTNGRAFSMGAAVWIDVVTVFPSLELPRAGSRGPGPHPVLRNPPPTANGVSIPGPGGSVERGPSLSLARGSGDRVRRTDGARRPRHHAR